MQKTKNLVYIIIALIIGVVFTYAYFKYKEDDGTTESSQVIQNQIKNLSKLIVIEGSYSDVYAYKDEDKYLGNWVKFEKKVLVVVNAKVQVMYDMKKLEIEVDSVHKTIFINKIPEPETQIIPDVKYYDIEQSSFNKFSAEDLNKIKNQAIKRIDNMAQKNELQKKAETRLIEELNNLFLVTKSMGWQIKNNTQYKLN